MPVALPAVVAVYLVLSLAESSAHPYDVVECEPELVCGYYVDHGGVSFMLIYLAEGMSVPC
ncbi:MAG: NADH-quinone oxidoreductase subunit H [Gammaproteobacteria bacterium]|nr:NADH-quinone oxidoreductase subunit H [Gammaproteobacteria bacterium]